MGVPTSEVGYTPAMPRREDHEVHKGHVVVLEKENQDMNTMNVVREFGQAHICPVIYIVCPLHNLCR